MRAGTLVPATLPIALAVIAPDSTLNEGRNFSSGNTAGGQLQIPLIRVRSMRAGTLVPATRLLGRSGAWLGTCAQ